MGPLQYTETARLLHWLIAAAIVLQYVLADLAETAGMEGAVLAQLALLANHKSVGMTILVLATVRLFWRWRNPPPADGSVRGWQAIAASTVHWLLYGMLFALPVSGWLMSSASAYSVSWFNLFEFPDLVTANENLKENLRLWHEWLAFGLFCVALVHMGAALKHALWDRDQVLSRMASTASLLVSVLVLIGGFQLLGSAPQPASDPLPAAEGVSSLASTAPMTVYADVDTSLAPWQVDYTKSFIEFTAEQAGAPFTGRWQSWQAQIRFDPERLAQSSALVSIEGRDVSTSDDERDATIRGTEFFDVEQFPLVTFRADRIVETASGYATQGVLTIKDLAVPTDFDFSVAKTAQGFTLTGNARLDRLAYNVGTGDWQDTTWVAQYVDVNVFVVALVDD